MSVALEDSVRKYQSLGFAYEQLKAQGQNESERASFILDQLRNAKYAVLSVSDFEAQQALWLRFIEGRKPMHVAYIMNCSRRTVYRKLNKGFEEIRNMKQE